MSKFEFRHGATRWVFLIGTVAIQVPRPSTWRQFLRGLLANLDEAEFYRRGSEGLCPVIHHFWGGWMTVMARATPLSDEHWAAIAMDAPDVWSAGELVDVEHKRSSWGRLGDTLVAVDYAAAR
ncbi:MAG TPA: hypothetical protein VN157_04410 [Caulobacter sp.]|nr:hypothetical protein [Caulobacter sp.]